MPVYSCVLAEILCCMKQRVRQWTTCCQQQARACLMSSIPSCTSLYQASLRWAHPLPCSSPYAELRSWARSSVSPHVQPSTMCSIRLVLDLVRAFSSFVIYCLAYFHNFVIPCIESGTICKCVTLCILYFKI